MEHLVKCSSNHNSIILRCSNFITSKVARHFCFEVVWCTDEEYLSLRCLGIFLLRKRRLKLAYEIVLTPKSDNLTTFKEFRHISLCDVSYKWVSKVLVNRLCPCLEDIVSPLQSSFILGKGNMGNAFILQKVRWRVLIQLMEFAKVYDIAKSIKRDMENETQACLVSNSLESFYFIFDLKFNFEKSKCYASRG
ncbi:hypothetical protein CR513_06496, partial [Mucuna pruriens]